MPYACSFPPPLSLFMKTAIHPTDGGQDSYPLDHPVLHAA
jgi:hypothetical protein